MRAPEEDVVQAVGSDKVEAIVGEPVMAVAVVVPPGSGLCRHYAPKGDVARIFGGPIASLVSSKKMKEVEGLAGQVPSQMGFLALTASSLLYLQKKKLGTAPVSVLATWPRSEVTVTFQDGGKRKSPGLILEFSDGSQSVVFSEKKWDLGAFAEAAG